MPTNSPATLVQVAAAVVALRSFWETGRASWEKVRATAAPNPDKTARKKRKNRSKSTKTGYVHGNKIERLKELAADEGMNHDTLQKAWRASQLYTREQIEGLCALVEEHRARFSATHLIRAMAVKDSRKRDALTRRAIRGRWGVARLGRAVQAVNGRREHVGKRPHVPNGRPELLNALIAQCEKWTRFCVEARPSLSDNLMVATDLASKAVKRVKMIAVSELTPDNAAT
jgi:hypothetical protein